MKDGNRLIEETQGWGQSEAIASRLNNMTTEQGLCGTWYRVSDVVDSMYLVVEDFVVIREAGRKKSGLAKSYRAEDNVHVVSNLSTGMIRS